MTNRLPVVIRDVLTERKRQDELHDSGKFSVSMEDPTAGLDHKLAVLVEEVGEVAHEINEMTGCNVPHDAAFLLRLRTELIQVAACAVAWCEGLPE